jgi:hypothetical protein
MPANELFLEGPINEGHRLRIDFFKLADRYGHRLSVVLRAEDGQETLVPLAESVEGAPDDPWPPSPPLQSLTIEERDDTSKVALLVGMAGRSHWSASIAVERATPSLFCYPVFELACRFTSQPTLLATTYRAAPGIVLGQQKGFVGLEHHESLVLAVFDASIASRVENNLIQFRVPLDNCRPPFTAQWRYVLFVKRVAAFPKRRDTLTA